MKLSLPAPSKNVVSLFELLVRNKNKPNFELRVGERVWAVLLSDMYPIRLKYRINSVLAWVQAPHWGKKEKKIDVGKKEIGERSDPRGCLRREKGHSPIFFLFESCF